MMKKFGVSFVVLFIVFLSNSTVFAQDTATMIAPNTQSPLFGQNHAYTVTFRGNGEAVVSARIVFTNMEDGSSDKLVLRVPNVEPQDIIAFQVIKEPRCVMYKPMMRPTTPECAQYSEPDYLNIWDGTTKYQKATVNLATDTLTVTLPKTIKTQTSGSIVLYYRAFGYAKKTLVGGYSYTFESLKTEQAIQNLQVGITTDSDLFLRGVKAKVNYRLEAGVTALKATDAVAAPMANQQINQYYQQIGQGDIVKTATNLQPLDSYTIKGSYADSWFKLYVKEVLIGAGVTVLFGVLVFFVVRALLGRVGTKKADAPNKNAQAILLVVGLSFVSAFVIAAYTVGVVILMRTLPQLIPYDSQMLITLLVVVVSFGIYGLFLLIPGLYLGIKRGLGYGIATAGLTILWLVFGLIALAIVFLGTKTQTTPYRGITPVMMDSSSGMEKAVEAPSTPE
jgi:hypothetical protein